MARNNIDICLEKFLPSFKKKNKHLHKHYNLEIDEMHFKFPR